MKTHILAAVAALALTTPAQAHEIWMERDGTGPVRVYLGEPVEPVPDGGDPEFAKLKAPQVFTGTTVSTAPLVRKADHLEATVQGSGDVRLYDAAVFDPWDNGAGGLDGAVFHARAGRSEPRGILKFEIVPVAADADSFTLLFGGQPLADAGMTLINPDRWSKSFKTDAKGVVTIPAEWSGRYLLAATHKVAGPETLGGKSVANVHHVTTLTFVK